MMDALQLQALLIKLSWNSHQFTEERGLLHILLKLRFHFPANGAEEEDDIESLRNASVEKLPFPRPF